MSEKMDEMEQTFAEASGIQLFGKIEDGLAAVMREHVQQMIRVAYEQGAVFGSSKRKGICEAAARYADTRILDLTTKGERA